MPSLWFLACGTPYTEGNKRMSDHDRTYINQCIDGWSGEGFEEIAEQARIEYEKLSTDWLAAIKANNEVGQLNTDLQERVATLENLIVNMESLLINLKEKRPFLDRHDNNNLAIDAMLKESERLKVGWKPPE
jgi:hypothetical protein